ncbi:MAG: prepilin-type N-terminal cleavage/methylation domain-containing protein [Verrucomicrobia bacterium]|nr:prepilin-type N-terminal cleavage/methylation domain-containing protein [Verrucomicrobiota bacterium]
MNTESRRPQDNAWQAAFTLLEVLIAMGIFFMAVFAILDLVAQNLRIARGLRLGEIEFSSVAAELSMTNRLTEGATMGDFGDLRPGASWTAETQLYSSNGLFRVDIAVDWPDTGLVRQRKGSILLYRPDSPNPAFAR